MRSVIVNRNAPFSVVISLVEWIAFRDPFAALTRGVVFYILLLVENGNLDGAKAPGLNDRKCPLYF